ncbi:hypothetical protein ACQW02_09585 [Humitalea sp. 24SJ18S-53]|uniref:hypothetical protein n=1 Tax=Humitalea sp. 24SJ18S-53 TaxID=3422307 RepID=UPI003D670120
MLTEIQDHVGGSYSDVSDPYGGLAWSGSDAAWLAVLRADWAIPADFELPWRLAQGLSPMTRGGVDPGASSTAADLAAAA